MAQPLREQLFFAASLNNLCLFQEQPLRGEVPLDHQGEVPGGPLRRRRLRHGEQVQN